MIPTISRGRPPVHMRIVLTLAANGVTAPALAEATGLSVASAGVRLRYWCLSGHLEAADEIVDGRRGRRFKSYRLTPEGTRDLAILHGTRPDQYDAGTELASILGYQRREVPRCSDVSQKNSAAA